VVQLLSVEAGLRAGTNRCDAANAVDAALPTAGIMPEIMYKALDLELSVHTSDR
jgi:hypothetical protein